MVFVNSECVYDLGSALLLFLLEMLPLAHVLKALFPACGAAFKSWGPEGGQWGVSLLREYGV